MKRFELQSKNKTIKVAMENQARRVFVSIHANDLLHYLAVPHAEVGNGLFVYRSDGEPFLRVVVQSLSFVCNVSLDDNTAAAVEAWLKTIKDMQP